MKKVLLALSFMVIVGLQALMAQTTNITGTVTDASDGSPIPGVSVFVKGTTIGTVTRPDGAYNLSVPNDATTLVFSFVGMTTQEIVIAGQTTINAVLQSDAEDIDEVIVVAYGTSKKSSFTGSASVVKADDLQKRQVESVTQALEGLATGVQVKSTSGQPGENATIRIRGIGSFQDADPLIVVDGFPFGGNINSIHPDDIENFTVLKDANATALYGSRASNGVIMITTKRGKAGTSKITFKATYGVSERGVPEYDRVSPEQYYEMFWERNYNNNIDLNASEGWGLSDGELRQMASDNLVPSLGNYNMYDKPSNQYVDPTTGKFTGGNAMWSGDWSNELIQTGIRQDYVLSASGGTDKTKYFISGGYLNSDGIVTASNFKRYSARVSAESELRDWITVRMNMSGSTSEQNFPNSSGGSYVNVFMFSRFIGPIYPVFMHDSAGQLILDGQGNRQYDYGSYREYDSNGDVTFERARPYGSNSNPLGVINLDTRSNTRDVASARGGVDIKFLKDFKLALNGSVDYYLLSTLRHQNQKYGDAEAFGGRSTRTTGRNFTATFNQLLTYAKTIGQHNVDVLLGHENYMFKYNYLNATRTGFPFEGLVELDAAATPEGSGSYEDNHRLESFFSRVNYDFAGKYYASASFRTDGSSRFHPDYRWGNFWSVGGSWRISEEEFMSSASWLTNLRLKASIGSVGNEFIGSLYAYPALYETGWNNITRPGLVASRLPTPNLTWETNLNSNIGIDATFLNRFGLNVEFFKRENIDLLMAKPLAASTGFTSIDANVGKINNTGIEIEINAGIIRNTNFTWDLNFNITKIKNEITELPQEEIISGTKKWEVGRSIYDFYIQDYAGVNSENGKAQWYYDEIETDGNGDPVYDDNGDPVKTGVRLKTEEYDEADRYYVGSAFPDFTGGLTNSFRYKNIDLSVLLTFSSGGKVYDGSYGGLMHGGEWGEHLHVDMLNRWTPDNTNTDVPRFDGDQNAASRSTRFLKDASYLNIKNISLGYNLPKVWMNRVGFESARIFAAADNVHLFSYKKGLDPQQTLSGVNDNAYSPIRTVSFGINVNF